MLPSSTPIENGVKVAGPTRTLHFHLSLFLSLSRRRRRRRILIEKKSDENGRKERKDMFICPSSWTARNNRRRKKERVKQNKKSDTLGTKKNTQRHVPGPNLTLSRRFSTFRLQRPSYDCSGVLYILTGDSIIIYKLRWRKNSVGPCANLELMVPEHLTDPTRSPRPDSSLQIKKGEKKKFLAGILRHESSTLALSFTIPCQLSTSKNALNQKRRDD